MPFSWLSTLLSWVSLAVSLRLLRPARASAERGPRLRNRGPGCAASQVISPFLFCLFLRDDTAHTNLETRGDQQL